MKEANSLIHLRCSNLKVTSMKVPRLLLMESRSTSLLLCSSHQQIKRGNWILAPFRSLASSIHASSPSMFNYRTRGFFLYSIIIFRECYFSDNFKDTKYKPVVVYFSFLSPISENNKRVPQYARLLRPHRKYIQLY